MQPASNTSFRIRSIDLLRGIIMIIMALDHTRDYFHKYGFYYDALDFDHTTVAIFLTRWVTHYCAPIFIFLSGVSASISGQRKTKQQLSSFLAKRGLWLLLLELTVVCFGWFFNPIFSFEALQVIWAFGICMLVLSLLIWLPKTAILIFGLATVLFHNLLDNVHVPGNGLPAFLWSQFHEFHIFRVGSTGIASAYPAIPWVGVMALGYCLGDIYVKGYPAEKRKNLLLRLGFACTLAFIVIRWTNVYGDPHTWSAQPRGAIYTLLSFINTNKYPPSLLYLLMTIGPGLIFLALTENVQSRFSAILSTYGRVPLFYYLLHIYVLHLFALIAAVLTGFPASSMIIKHTWITANEALKGYGFSLPVVYVIWLCTVILLYPLCKRYDAYKQSHRHIWWLSYV